MAQITLNSSGVASSGSLLLQTNGTTTQATVDTSGNLGLGVTPSAWGSGRTVLEMSSSAYLMSQNVQINLMQNAYYDGSAWRYKNTNYAAYFQVANGAHSWYNAPSGTAGNAITFTQAMTLDASGNLLVNTTSAAAGKLAVKSSDANTLWLIGRASDGTSSVSFRNNADSAYNARIECFDTGVMTFGTGTSATERARITSSGGLWVGTATRQSTSNHAFIQQTTSDWTANFQCNGSSAQNLGVLIYYSASAPNGTGNSFLQCSDSSATRAEIRSNGGLANYSANNVNLSDERTKTNIQDAGSYLSKICAIPVRTFKYKDQTDDELNLGVIAQEVEAVAPELVDVSGFGETPEDGVPLKAIYQTDLQYALMKCIQEQQAIITQLQADVAALKGQA